MSLSAHRPHYSLAEYVRLEEVTSPSTEGYDRGDKLEHYKRIPSLREVLLVSHAEHRVDVWGRQDDGTWAVQSVGSGGSVRLASIDCELAVDSVYRDPLAAS